MRWSRCLVAGLLLIGSAHAIVGGSEADEGEYPWMAALYNGDDPYWQYCGGSLIAPDRVVTAAHCVEGLLGIDLVDQVVNTAQYGQYMVMLGSNSLLAGGDEIPVLWIHVHPDYAQDGTPDVAVLVLAEDATQAPIPWATPADEPLYAPGTRATVTGWGALSENGPYPDALREVEVPIVSDDDCLEAYPFWLDPGTEVCAGYKQGGKDACYGDSGGPLMVPDGGGMLLVGIVSWGEGCARAGKPGVYAEVAAVSDWIGQDFVEDLVPLP